MSGVWRFPFALPIPGIRNHLRLFMILGEPSALSHVQPAAEGRKAECASPRSQVEVIACPRGIGHGGSGRPPVMAPEANLDASGSAEPFDFGK